MKKEQKRKGRKERKMQERDKGYRDRERSNERESRFVLRERGIKFN